MRLKNILLLIAASIILKVAYLIFAYYVLDNPEVLTLDGYSSILNRNDASWYEKIANNWYPEITDVRDLGYSHDADFKQSEWAFFPLYPWLNRVMMSLFHITFNQSGFILSLLFSSKAVTLLQSGIPVVSVSLLFLHDVLGSSILYPPDLRFYFHSYPKILLYPIPAIPAGSCTTIRNNCPGAALLVLFGKGKYS